MKINANSAMVWATMLKVKLPELDYGRGVGMQKRVGPWLVFLWLLCASPVLQAQSTGAWSGVLEEYFQASRPSKGLYYNESWLELRHRISKDWKVILTYDHGPDDFTFDANYLEYDQPWGYVKGGRLRTSFGFGQWSDTNYNVIFQDPLIRQGSVLPTVGLDREDVGLEGRFNVGLEQVTLGVLDIHPNKLQVNPEDMDHLFGRYQTQWGQLIVGADAIVKSLDHGDDDGNLYGIDFRWTHPHLLMRGEYVRGDSHLYQSNGWYVDVTYRPAHLYRTELGIRQESFGIVGTGDRSDLTTVGARQVFGSSVTCNLNFGFGKATADVESMRGWSFETVYFIHF